MTITLETTGSRIALDTGLALDTGTAAPPIALDGTAYDDDDDMPSPEEAEIEAAGEVSNVLTGFRDRANREDQRFTDATDSEFWIALCFQTREQKEEFLRKARWMAEGDKYLDGMAVAQIMGITLESRIPALPKLQVDRRLSGLTMD